MARTLSISRVQLLWSDTVYYRASKALEIHLESAPPHSRTGSRVVLIQNVGRSTNRLHRSDQSESASGWRECQSCSERLSARPAYLRCCLTVRRLGRHVFNLRLHGQRLPAERGRLERHHFWLPYWWLVRLFQVQTFLSIS